ncbi:MAG TPA: hypothetical protein DDX54_03435 [Rhodospirillaceae bacterium]|jgi:hypothetical protein|nr:hypothetical protein [Alphaproteobacteria bacterium]HBH26436.1 hypothetical protein [Rhodospirillaceae bacterium]
MSLGIAIPPGTTLTFTRVTYQISVTVTTGAPQRRDAGSDLADILGSDLVGQALAKRDATFARIDDIETQSAAERRRSAQMTLDHIEQSVGALKMLAKTNPKGAVLHAEQLSKKLSIAAREYASAVSESAVLEAERAPPTTAQEQMDRSRAKAAERQENLGFVKQAQDLKDKIKRIVDELIKGQLSKKEQEEIREELESIGANLASVDEALTAIIDITLGRASGVRISA